MEFFLGEEQRIFQDTFRKLAEAEIAPLVEEAEETETFPLQLFPQMGKLGYLCPRYSKKYGGAGNCVGMAQGAYEAALTYAKERVQFGQPPLP